MPQLNETVNQYLAQLPPERQEALGEIRKMIFEIVPDVRETIKYKMPTYEKSKLLFAFASQKNYMSLYLMNTDIVEKHRPELPGLNVGKSCIRFKKLEKLPLDVVKVMLQEAVDKM